MTILIFWFIFAPLLLSIITYCIGRQEGFRDGKKYAEEYGTAKTIPAPVDAPVEYPTNDRQNLFKDDPAN